MYPLDDVVGDEVFDVSLVEAVQDVSPLALRVSIVSRSRFKVGDLEFT